MKEEIGEKSSGTLPDGFERFFKGLRDVPRGAEPP